MINDNLLVICRNTADLFLIRQSSSKESSSNIYVASDSITILELAKKNPLVRDVTFIEQMNSVFNVLDAVLIVREKLNQWLFNKIPNISEYIVGFEKHAERGFTTQKIQDILLLIDSYLAIFDKYNINKIILNRNIDTIFEDEILLNVATSKNINIIEYKKLSYLVGSRLNLVRFSRRLFGFVKGQYLPAKLYYFVKRIVLYIHILKFSLKRCKILNLKSQKLIVFLLDSSADKHIDNISIIMEEFNKRKLYYSQAVCWNCGTKIKKFHKLELEAVDLESFITLKSFLRIVWENWKIRKLMSNGIREIHNYNELKYKKIKLGNLLQSSVRYLINYEILNRAFIYDAAENYFKFHKPIAMKCWGAFWLAFGLICFDRLKFSLRKDEGKPVIFDNCLGLNGDLLYGKPTIDALDLYFINGEAERKFFNNINNSTEYIVSGYSRQQLLLSVKNTSQIKSFERLKLQKTTRFVIFYATSGVIRGIISPMEYSRLTESLCHIAQDNNVLVIIKPHPSELLEFLYYIYEHLRKPDNVKILAKELSSYDCINISDLVVTKVSAVAYEAMVFEKPVISVVLDGEPKFFNVFEGACERIDDINRFTAFMGEIVRDNNKFVRWSNKIIEQQNRILPTIFSQPENLSQQIIVDSVIKKINLNKSITDQFLK